MKLSIITVTWRSKEDIVRLIESFKIFVQNTDYEIIVVDNNSADGTPDLIRQKYPAAKVIANAENKGYSGGMNQGLAVAEGEYVLFMNPDMVLTEDCITPLLNKLEADETIGLIGPQLRYGDGSLQPTVKNDPGLLSQVLILLKLHHVFKPKSLNKYLAKDFDYNRESEVEQLMGAFLMGRTETIRKIGGWDNDYPLWWEDLQFCTDTRRNGYKVIYTPSTHLTHFEGKSAAQALTVSKQKRFNKGMRIYFRKNHGLISFLILSIISPISLGLAYISQLLKIGPRTQSRL
jgi:GT2 family glycosyltransferase